MQLFSWILHAEVKQTLSLGFDAGGGYQAEGRGLQFNDRVIQTKRSHRIHSLQSVVEGISKTAIAFKQFA